MQMFSWIIASIPGVPGDWDALMDEGRVATPSFHDPRTWSPLFSPYYLHKYKYVLQVCRVWSMQNCLRASAVAPVMGYMGSRANEIERFCSQLKWGNCSKFMPM